MDIARHIFTLSLVMLALGAVLGFGIAEQQGRDAGEGMRQEALALPMVPQMVPTPYIAPALGLQRYMDCQRQRGRAALRLQIAHKRDREGITIHCFYDQGVYL